MSSLSKTVSSASQTHTPVPIPTTTEEDDYNSSEDEDFKPETYADAPVSDSSGSDNEVNGVGEDDKIAGGKGKRKRKEHGKEVGAKKAKTTTVAEGNELAELDSGDEATIRKGKRRKGKAKGELGDADVDDDDEGGEGGLVKTRAQKAKESVHLAVSTSFALM